jgi:hypothetical protein
VEVLFVPFSPTGYVHEQPGARSAVVAAAIESALDSLIS